MTRRGTATVFAAMSQIAFHDPATMRFVSADCVAFTDCKTEGPQDILCDTPDAAICYSADVDSGARVCKVFEQAFDGTEFGGISICY